MPAGRTASVVFLGNDAALNATLARIEGKLKALSTVAEEQNAKTAASADRTGAQIGKAYEAGAAKAGFALDRLGKQGAMMGVPLSGALSKVGKQFDETALKADGLHSKLERLGKVTLTAGAVGFGAAAFEGVKGAMALQAAMERLHTQAGATQAQVGQLTKGVLGMAGATGTGPKELATGLYNITSALNKTLPAATRSATELKVLRVAADGAKMGNANLVDVTHALDSALVAGLKGVGNYGQAMGAMNATVGAGEMTMQDLADALGSSGIQAVAGEAGLSIKDLGAGLAVLGDNGVRGAEAGTKLSSAIRIMGAPSQAAAKAFGAIGLSALQLGHDMRSGGLLKAMEDLKQHFKDSGATADQQALIMNRAFGGRQSTGVRILLTQLDRLKASYKQVGAGGQQEAQNVAAYHKTLAFQMDQLKATVQALADKFGMYLIPKLQAAGNAIKDVIAWMDKHKAAAHALADVIAGVLGTAIAVFAYTKAVAFVGATKNMVLGIGKLATGVGSAVTTIATKLGVMSTATATTATEVGASNAAAGASFTAVGTEATAAQVEVDAKVAAMAAGVGTADDAIVASNEAAGASFTALLGPIAAVVGAAGGALLLIHQLGGAGGAGNPSGVARNQNTTGLSPRLGSLGVGPGAGGGGGYSAPAGSVSGGGPMGNGLSPSSRGSGATGPGGVWTGASGQVTPTSFAASVLSRLGITPTPQNIQDFTAWEQQEGGNWNNQAHYNPLNTTMGEPGAGNTGAQGNIKQYTSWAQGLAATVATLQNGSYAGILAALRGSASLPQFSAAVGSSPWGTGGVSAQGTRPTSSALSKYLASATGGGTTRAAKKVTYGPSQNVLHMLTLAEQLAGTPYTEAGHASAYTETVAQIKKFGTDCSGLVSVLLKEGVSGIRAAQTTQGLPTSAGLAPGVGKYVTVYDRHTGPANQEHTFIEILGKYFEEGGVLQNHAGQMTKAQVAQELAGGGFQAYHPTAGPLADAVRGGKGSFSSAAAGASLQQAIDAWKKAVAKAMATYLAKLGTQAVSELTRLGNAMQSGTIRTLSAALGENTSTFVATPSNYLTGRAPHGYGGLSDPNAPTWPWLRGRAPHGYGGLSAPAGTQVPHPGTTVSAMLDRGFAGLGGNASIDQINRATGTALTAGAANSPQEAGFNKMIARLDATHNKGLENLATKLVAAHKAALQTLGQELYANQVTKNAESVALVATQTKDLTTMQANYDADMLNVQKAWYQMANDKAQAQVTAIRDMTTVVQDQFAGMVQSVTDSAKLMSDAANATVQGIQDQTQVQVDILGERGLYGLNLVAQKLQVQLDQTKATDDQKIALAQQNLDQVTATWHAATSAAQINLDQVTMQQDALVAQAQMGADLVTMQQDARIATAQAKMDAMTLHEDVSVIGPAQTAVDLNANAPRAVQDVFAAQLKGAMSVGGLREAAAGKDYQGVYDSAQFIMGGAGYTVEKATTDAAAIIGLAGLSLTNITGQANAVIQGAQSGLTGAQDTAALNEAPLASGVTTTQARASTQFAGSGLVVNMYGVDLSNPTAVGNEASWALRTAING